MARSALYAFIVISNVRGQIESEFTFASNSWVVYEELKNIMSLKLH